MRRLKKVAVVVWLAIAIGTSANVALGGTQEAPGNNLYVTVESSGTVESPGATVNGVTETPGFDEIILFTVTLIM